MLFITQPENGTVIVESPINTGHARFYRPGSEASTPVPGGTIATRSSWTGTALVAEGTASTVDGSPARVREAWSISSDGATLTVDVSRTGASEQTSRLIYTRLESAGPCQSWPTPCKR
jgi:hypothetical protein